MSPAIGDETSGRLRHRPWPTYPEVILIHEPGHYSLYSTTYENIALPIIKINKNEEIYLSHTTTKQQSVYFYNYFEYNRVFFS